MQNYFHWIRERLSWQIVKAYSWDNAIKSVWKIMLLFHASWSGWADIGSPIKTLSSLQSFKHPRFPDSSQFNSNLSVSFAQTNPFYPIFHLFKTPLLHSPANAMRIGWTLHHIIIRNVCVLTFINWSSTSSILHQYAGVVAFLSCLTFTVYTHLQLFSSFNKPCMNILKIMIDENDAS